MTKHFHHQADDRPMNDRTLSVLAIALSIVAIIASVSAIVISQDAGDDMEDSWKYTTYFGLEDISPDRADEIEKEIEDLVTQTYGLGFTNFRASGGAVVDGSVVTDDVTLVFVFIWAEEETIHELVEDVREKYGISTVLIEKHKVSAELIG